MHGSQSAQALQLPLPGCLEPWLRGFYSGTEGRKVFWGHWLSWLVLLPLSPRATFTRHRFSPDFALLHSRLSHNSPEPLCVRKRTGISCSYCVTDQAPQHCWYAALGAYAPRGEDEEYIGGTNGEHGLSVPSPCSGSLLLGKQIVAACLGACVGVNMPSQIRHLRSPTTTKTLPTTSIWN